MFSVLVCQLDAFSGDHESVAKGPFKTERQLDFQTHRYHEACLLGQVSDY